MAYVNNEDKLLENQSDQYGGQPINSGGGSVSLSGGSSTDVGSNQQSAGVSGKGGTGGWTNIQDYLNANNVDSGASGAIQSKADSIYGDEKSKIDSGANQALTEARNSVGPLWTSGQAKDKVNAAAGAYSWKGEQADQYKNDANDFKNYLGKNYSGPKDYTYSIGSGADQISDAMKTDDTFNKYMGDYYSDKVKSPLNYGQRALQTQLNVSNDALNTMRDNIIKGRSGLGEYRDATVKDTTKKLSDIESGLVTSQKDIRDGLGMYASELDKSEKEQQNAKREDLIKRGRPLDGLRSEVEFLRNRDLGKTEREKFNTIVDFLGLGDQKKERYYDITNGGGYLGRSWVDRYNK